MTFELRPPEGVNLADDRADCGKCDTAGMIATAGQGGTETVTPCPVCHGKGSYPKPTGRAHLSHSSLATFINCAKKYEWQRVEHLEEVERPRPLGMGAAFQKSIELGVPEAGVQFVREGREIHHQEAEDRARADEAIVRAAATLYLDRFGAPSGEQREFEYLVPLRSPWTGRLSRTFDLLGYADALTETEGWLELTENKLVGRVDKSSIKKLPLDRQIALACYGCWRATGKTVRVVHYRYVQKPSIRQRQNETIDEYCERVAADYLERPDFYAHEETFFRDDKDLLQIEAELWTWADELRKARHREFWPRNSSVCGEWGGCPYIPLCVGDPDAPALYRKRPQPEEIAA